MADSQSDVLRALVVDDDPDVQKLVIEVLTREGHVGVGAGSAEDALKALPESTFDVAFIDHHLPGLNGMVFAEYLQRTNPTMRVALVSGDETAKLARLIRKVGVDFIAKPFPIAAIVSVLNQVKTIRRAERRAAKNEAHEDYAPPLGRYRDELAGLFQLPTIPRRAHDALIESIKTHLNALRHERRYDERDRVAALAGLLAASVIGTDLPTTSDGRTLFEEYDDLMRRQGRRVEFSSK
jgi:CheY-like chemotaxis protein